MATDHPAPDDLSRIRVLFPDHHGLARGKYLPRRVAAEGTHNCITLFALDFDRTMVPAPGAMLLEGNPDMKVTFDLEQVRRGWEPRTGVVVGDLSYADEPLAIAPRNVLKKAIADWRALGYEPMVGIELEAFVLEPDGKGGWQEWSTPGAYVYGTGRAVDPVGLLDDLMTVCDSVGLPIESINSEYETPQFELTLSYSDALTSVDNVFLFKVLARELAHEKGLLLTYLGKPFGDRGGSGLHVNFSLCDAGGDNVMDDPTDPDGLSAVARSCIAGLLEHHEGLAALCAPTVNAYKRLRPAQLSGYWANWGKDHRSCTVRVPSERGAATRLEHRMPDGAANPYLATAAVLQAARLGFEQGLTPPPAETLDAFEEASTDRHVPENLSLALDALEADKALVEAFGSAAIDHFVFIKRNEWDKFAAAVTDWELRHYLPFL
jgi:glutamine synthetase